MFKGCLYAILGLLLFLPVCHAEAYNLLSPDERIEIRVNTGQTTEFSVFVRDMAVIAPSSISMELGDGSRLGTKTKVTGVERNTWNKIVQPVVREKFRELVDLYNELKIDFEGDYGLVFRAYNNGVAYRFETDYCGDIQVVTEEVCINFAPQDTVYFPEEKSFLSHNEREYKVLSLDSIASASFCSLPVLVNTQSGVKVLITEADLEDYPGLWLKVKDSHTLTGILPGVALEEELVWDRTLKVTKRADYIAQTKGPRNFPWRVMAIAEQDADLILNQMVYLLSKPLELEDVTWIEPGKVAWDFWNALNLYDVDFEAGFNTETYKYYIDFASQYGIEYVILDEGWYILRDLLSVNPDIDMEELTAYARDKNVGIILWVVWKTLDEQLEAALDQFEKWGIRGIKVDYMQRDDQWMVNYYRKIAREAAKRKLLVDFHGSYKPAGLRRAYPNVLTREGVRGLEYCKMMDVITPEHDVTIPFIRMVAGPMDYTPGAMINAQERNFRVIRHQPMSKGTRCHQLAMFVVYESPLQMLADSPSNYLREPECMEFLAKVPTEWDETVVLDAQVGDLIAIARCNAEEWYVGAMTDENARELMIDFSFLDDGEYRMDYYQDGTNAHRYGSDYRKVTLKVTRNQQHQIQLAPGGGCAARIYRY